MSLIFYDMCLLTIGHIANLLGKCFDLFVSLALVTVYYIYILGQFIFVPMFAVIARNNAISFAYWPFI